MGHVCRSGNVTKIVSLTVFLGKDKVSTLNSPDSREVFIVDDIISGQD